MWAKLAIRLFFRELRRGELTVICAAIALAVMTVLTLSSVTDRIGQAILQKSNAFIAADRALASNHALPENYLEQAQSMGLQTARLTFFDTMLFANERMQLAAIKAASNDYPLKGELLIKRDFDAQEQVAQGGPGQVRFGSTSRSCIPWTWRWVIA